MRMFEWIVMGLIVGGLGLTVLASRSGYGADSVDNNSTRQQSAKGSHAGGGRYYRGGKR